MFDASKNYTRNLIATDDETFTLMLLCWNADKESPIHDHVSVCYGFLANILLLLLLLLRGCLIMLLLIIISRSFFHNNMYHERSHAMDVGSAYVKDAFVRHAMNAMMKLTLWK